MKRTAVAARGASLLAAAATIALCITGNARAQAPRINPEAQAASTEAQLAAMAALIEQRPDVQGLGQAVGMLGTLSKATDGSKADARRLVNEAAPYQKEGNSGEARRRLTHAAALLLGQGWSDRQEFGASLVLRTDQVVADLELPFLLLVSQSYPIRQGGKDLKLRFAITAASPRVATDVVIPAGQAVRELRSVELPNRDLIDQPLRLALDLTSIEAGAYLLIAEVGDGEGSIARIATPVYLVQNIEVRRRAVESKLRDIKAFDSTKATIRYPFALAEGLNARNLEITSFDFAGQMRRSEQLAEALSRGRDPLIRGKGDQRRNYWFAEAGEIMPYRLYVPKSWDGKKQLPLVVALHGGSLDENNMLDRGEGIVGKLAEQHGFIVASPLGYRVNGGYGSIADTASAAQTRLAKLSEQDVLNVLENVASEYNVDRSRIYLMGNSMGAGGTWVIASKHGELFAGLAPCASSMNIRSLPFDKFRNMPVLSCVGELDTDTRKETAKFGIAKVKEISPHAEYVEVPGGTHGTGIQLAMPQIFEFFAQYKKQP